MSAGTGRVSIARFSSDTGTKSGITRNCDFFVLEIKWLTIKGEPFSSSKTTCSISAKSCWLLKLKDTPLMLDSLRFKAHKNLYGSTGFLGFFLTAMLRLIACNIGDKMFDCEGTLLQGLGITLKICRMELAEQVLPLLMTPVDNGLVVCLRNGIEGGELQISSEESMSLQLAAEGVQSLCFWSARYKRRISKKICLIFYFFFFGVLDKSTIEIQLFKTS